MTAPFLGINSHPELFLRLVLSVSFAQRRHLGYDTSVSGFGADRRLKSDLACDQQGLRDLQLQLVLHMTGKINGRGTTIRLLKVDSETLTNFYGDRKSQFMSLPGVEPGQKDFGIIAKDSWEEAALNDSEVLSEGMILQLLHAKGVPGVSWCLDEEAVAAPDAPPPPIPLSYQPAFLDNTLYIRSRWGIRALRIADYASRGLYNKGVNNMKLRETDAAVVAQKRSFAHRAKEKLHEGVEKVRGMLPSSKSKATRGGKKSSPTSPPSATSPDTTTPQPEGSHTPQILLEDENDSRNEHHFMTRCHVRSYIYPVGTPIYWFRSLLELLCVFRDILES